MHTFVNSAGKICVLNLIVIEYNNLKCVHHPPGWCFFFVLMNKEDFKKNAPGWSATAKDYRLVFRVVDGCWREISNNLPQYSNIILADYCAQMGIEIPEGCELMRVRRGEKLFAIRRWGASIVIDLDCVQL